MQCNQITHYAKSSVLKLQQTPDSLNPLNLSLPQYPNLSLTQHMIFLCRFQIPYSGDITLSPNHPPTFSTMERSHLICIILMLIIIVSAGESGPFSYPHPDDPSPSPPVAEPHRGKFMISLSPKLSRKLPRKKTLLNEVAQKFAHFNFNRDLYRKSAESWEESYIWIRYILWSHPHPAPLDSHLLSQQNSKLSLAHNLIKTLLSPNKTFNHRNGLL